jgi:hypothetical protein
MLFGALQLLEEPAREWVASLQKNIAGSGSSPMINFSSLLPLCRCKMDVYLQLISCKLALYPVPIAFADGKCSP